MHPLNHLLPGPWWVYALAEIAWIAWMIVWQVGRRRPAAVTFAWVLALSLLPLVGLPLYYLLGPPRLDKRRARYLRTAAPQFLAAPQVGALELAPQARALAEEARAPFVTPLLAASAYRLIRDGRALYEDMLSEIAAARDHVHVECYIWEPDALGVRMRDALARKAAETGAGGGRVRVRVIYDALGSSKLPRKFFAPLIAAGGRVSAFNPPWSSGGSRYNMRPLRRGFFKTKVFNFRTHRKLLVVDGRVGYTGGMNISGVHSSEFSGADAWRDTHLRIEGGAVRGLQETFLQQWNYIHSKKLESATFYPPGPAGAIPVQIYRTGPLGAGQPIRDALISALYAARRYAYLTTPYLIPDEALMAALHAAVRRKVDVRLLVPRKGDSRLVTAAGRAFHEELLAAGVQLYEYGPPMLHAKSAVIDDWFAMVGSCNLDPRSFKLNFEVMAALYDAGAAETLKEWFGEDLMHAQRVTPELLASRERDRTERVWMAVGKLLAPIL